jgi:hypothetical protein
MVLPKGVKPKGEFADGNGYMEFTLVRFFCCTFVGMERQVGRVKAGSNPA